MKSYLFLFVTALLAVMMPSVTAHAQPTATALPYDRTCPVIYDNDGAIESGYTDIYMMALASAKAIRLKGIITTCSYGEEQRKPPFSPIAPSEIIRERQELIEKARRSGLKNLPDATPGPSLSLKRPATGRIEDTAPHRTPGSALIIREARKATPKKPLVIVMGGQATCAVSAYLIDPSIAGRMVLAWIVGNKRPDGNIDTNEYNAGVDPWATYIAFERLRVVAFPFTNNDNDADDPIVLTPKSRLQELPDTELRQTIREAAWPRGGGTYSEPSADYDAMGAFPLTRPDYVVKAGRVSFSRWEPSPWDPKVQLPFYKSNPGGRAMAVWEARPNVASEEWWRRVKDPSAWKSPKGQVPFHGSPRKIPGTVEAERFDEGGEGRAYHDTAINFTREDGFNPIRFLEQADIIASASASGGYMVGRTEAGEWLEYTLRAARAGSYRLEARIASEGTGGTFHIEFEGIDQTGPIAVPATGGPDAWQTVSRPLSLKAGVQVMRVVMDRNSSTGGVMNLDWIKLTPAAAPPKQGAFAATQMKGPLRIHPANPRYFTDSGGKAIYLTGSHTWSNLQDMGEADPPGPFDFGGYLDLLRAHRHNFIRLWRWELPQWMTAEGKLHYCTPQPWLRTGPGQALDGKPRYDLSRFDPQYFDRLRQRISAARDRGIYVSIMLFEGWGMQFVPDAWRSHPFHPENNINIIPGNDDPAGKGLWIHTMANPAITALQEAYVRKVIDTVNAFDNVLYEISNENHPGSTEWQYHMILYIRKYESRQRKRHPVGMTFQYEGGSNTTLFASPADWVSPNPEGGYRDDPPPADGKKVVLSDTDHLWGEGGSVQWVWKSFLRGHNPIFMDRVAALTGSKAGDIPGAKDIRKAMGTTREWSQRIDLSRMVPMNNLSSTGYCLANPGKEYLAYLPDGGEVTVDLTATKGRLASVWLHPIEGTETPGETVEGGDRHSFKSPFDGDAVLHIRQNR
ncbi:MAG: carbohydrate-binding protein [Armatimonadetes bacterium]|nr:carbohydrate-binding protein [Armatimonadota bacterium]